MHPLLILAIGVLSIIFLIAALRLNAFIALIVSAIIVSLLAPGEFADKINRVAVAFGGTAGNIGIVIALAVVIGKCMMDSGAADRIVRAFLSVLGEKRCSWALMSSGFVLAIPVFFDTVFYLLVPLARSMHHRTGRHVLSSSLAICVGGVVTHSIVPPTPGPLLMADQLGIDLGVMILFGALVAIRPALSAWPFDMARPPDNIEMRPLADGMTEPGRSQTINCLLCFPLCCPSCCPLCWSRSNTDDRRRRQRPPRSESFGEAGGPGLMAMLGNVNFAMLLSTAIAMWVLKSKRS